MRIHSSIRAALESKLVTITDLPVVSWENRDFSPTTNTPYIKVKYIPLSQDPAHLGVLPQLRYEGIFRVDCLVPFGTGPFEGDDLAQDILDNFRATTDIFLDQLTEALLTEDGAFIVTETGQKVLRESVTHVSIRYADREQGDKHEDGPFYKITVNIGWYCYN